MENDSELKQTPELPTKPSPKIKAICSSDEKAPDSSENNGVAKKAEVSKGKKRKKAPKDSTAPRHPLTGYVRYLNDRRESVRTENPALGFAEITKMLANEWNNLPIDRKQQYLDAAEQDRERYNREFSAYKQTESYKQFTQSQKNEKKLKEESAQQKNASSENMVLAQANTKKEKDKEQKDEIILNQSSDKTSDFLNFDIPIFTEEFLDHNKNREAELRQLRKSNTDYEQQNAVLQKHIEHMKAAIEKLENETSQQRNHIVALQRHLDHLRSTLTTGFANVKLPGTREVATIQTIDNYIASLHKLLLENNNHTLVRTVREIISRLNFEG